MRKTGREIYEYHGGVGTKLYNSWRAMKQRCYDPSQYKPEYQGKGITVSSEWQKFAGFREWAYVNGYKEGLSIDRIDVDGDYCPENCRWITRSENSRQRNFGYDYSKAKFSRRFIIVNGMKLNVREYVELRGLVYNTFRKGIKNMPLLLTEQQLTA